jgi:hypothetical protein
MEHMLALYQKPHDPKRPLVCFDEKSTQLLFTPQRTSGKW